MRPVVIDTSWLLPAFLSRSERPWARNLLVLTALGGLTLRERTLEDEHRTLLEEAERLGAAVNDVAFEGRLEAVRSRREQFRSELGLRAPDDLYLVGSRHLFDEVERKVREIGVKFDPQLPPDAPAMVRRQVERVTAQVVEIDTRERLAAWTRDPQDDYLIEMAFRAEAFAIVSRDADIVPGGKRRATWTDSKRGLRVEAYWLSEFVQEHVNNSGFTIDDVDPALLKLAVLPLT